MITSLIPAELPLPRAGAPRSPGVHASSIIRCIASENGILKPEWVESLDLVDLNQGNWWESLPARVRIIISMGQAWDDYYLPTLGDITPHPGEMELDGVYMTHDGESLDVVRSERGQGMVLACHEVKLTYKSTKTVGDLRTQWMWLAQMRAYCKALRTRLAYLHCLFVCGDYKFPITPQLLKWRIEFTQAEIDENWDILIGYVRHRQAMEDFTL